MPRSGGQDGPETSNMNRSIGAGPRRALCTPAIRRRPQLGPEDARLYRTREHLGGICLNWGCIPTERAMLRLGGGCLHLMHRARSSGYFGQRGIGYDLIAVVKRLPRCGQANSRRSSGIFFRRTTYTTVDGGARHSPEGPVYRSRPGTRARRKLTAPAVVLATGRPGAGAAEPRGRW